jgi:hypothetical protein
LGRNYSRGGGVVSSYCLVFNGQKEEINARCLIIIESEFL